MRSTTHLRAVGAATMLALLVGCGGAEGGGDKPAAPSSSAPADGTPTPGESETASLTAYDPPTRFENHGSFEAPGLGTVALDGQKAYYVAPGVLVARDLAADEEIGTLEAGTSSWRHDPEHDGTYKTLPHAPGLGTADGKRYAVAAFPTSTKGSGSSPDSIGVEVVAMDAESGQEAWRTKWDLDRSDDGYLVTYVAGVVGRTAIVVSHGEYRYPVTYGIDLVTHKETWRDPAFKAQLVQGTRVIGQKRGAEDVLALAAVDGANGRELWTGMEVPDETGADQGWTAKAFGPDRVWVADPYGRAVVDSATGKDLKYEGFGERLHEIETCVDDQLRTTICAARTVEGGEISAYDRSGKRLWRVGGPSDDSGRKEMLLKSAFHGVVYAAFNDGTGAAIVLDGATGADKATDPGFSPLLVNTYVGLIYRGNGRVDGFRATR
ncbi:MULTISPECIES: outer membrane protein assembly factor BamB family protein [unclassified Streptomyces]|uniref:outer membrane protein assembly factor BamB family protein n=1 Tax=Streptomyces sp. NPDC127129 TaxID=3345373 RepID=UPI00362AD040